MMQVGLRFWGVVWLAGCLALAGAERARGVALDKDGDFKLGIRTYTAARIGAEHTDLTIKPTFRSYTFPYSPDGHLRQHRVFAQAEFQHDLKRLLDRGYGPLALLNSLPFRVSTLKYQLEFRGEYEGIYDYGPSEFRDNDQFFDDSLVQLSLLGASPALGTLSKEQFRANVSNEARRRLRNIGVQRQRFFQGFVDFQAGDLFLRAGRQILAWGETDAFRLMDNINPTDSSFGGFLVSLDERRVPLDMLRANYYVGNIGPISEMFVEAYGAIDNSVGFDPGIPSGSPWNLPNLGAPSTNIKTTRSHPRRNFTDMRGGALLKFNAPMPGVGETTFSLAHYYTYFDTPAVKTSICDGFPTIPLSNCYPNIDYLKNTNYLVLAEQSAPRVQVTGLSSTFAIPAVLSRMIAMSGEPIIRTEIAYFRGEPRFSQGQLDPFLYYFSPQHDGTNVEPRTSGGRRTGDSWNAVLGMDINQYFRFLNPNQTFFISTQFFYKHLNGSARRKQLDDGSPSSVTVFEGEVLPVPEFNTISQLGTQAGAVRSLLIHNPVDQFLQTLFVTTAYFSGQVLPSFGMFYDWGGSIVVQPGVTLSRDPFRFRVEYNYLYASRLKGGSGTSLLRDRDNVLFQFEYVL